MSETPKFAVREATREDLPGVLAVQHRAFARVASGLGIDPALMPPLQESLLDLERLFEDGTRFFVAVKPDATVVGSVRGALTDDGAVEIGRLVVDDGWQRRGVASAVMDALEAGYPSACRFELFTGEQATAPLALYAKRGYEVFRREDYGHVVLVWLEKPGPCG